MSRKVLLSVFLVVAIVFIFWGQKYYNSKLEQAGKEAKTTLAFDVKETDVKEKNYFKKDRGNLVYSAIGDSLTAGYYSSTENKRFVNVLSSLLENKMGFSVKTFSNGNYGGTLSNGLKAINQINSQRPDLVTVEFGTNDLNEQNNVPVNIFKNELNKMIDGITQNVNKTPKIVLVTTWNQGEKSQPFDDAIYSVGKKRHILVANVSALWHDSSNIGPAGKRTFQGKSDNFHPNDKGHAAIAQTIFDVVKDEINTK